MNHDPASFKRLRRHLFALGREPEDRPLPIAAAVLLYVHTYTVLGNGKGTLYEIVAARALGVTRAQMVETLALATLQGGPLAVNAFAEYCDEYIARVAGGRGRRAVARRLGARCRRPPLRHRSRHGHARGGRARADPRLVQRTTGSVPAHVDLLAERGSRRAEDAAGPLRDRRARRAAGPARPAPRRSTCSAIRLQPTPLRRSLLLARSLGVRRGEALATLFWAAVYGGDVVMETAIDSVADVLAEWS